MRPHTQIVIALVSLILIAVAFWDSGWYPLVTLSAALAAGWVVGGALLELRGGP